MTELPCQLSRSPPASYHSELLDVYLGLLVSSHSLRSLPQLDVFVVIEVLPVRLGHIDTIVGVDTLTDIDAIAHRGSRVDGCKHGGETRFSLNAKIVRWLFGSTEAISSK